MSPNRNRVFGWYYTLSALALAFGSLAAGLPSWLNSAVSLGLVTGHRIMFGAYAALALASLLCFTRLPSAVELERPPRTAPKGWLGLGRSRRTIAKLSALFGLDALGGGFIIQSMLAYWFAIQFDVGGEILGPVFLGVNFMKAISYPLAVRIANRYGLVNTMVFTHLPSNILLLFIPLMPSLPLAIACLLARHLLSQMDVPARSSYIVAIVDPEESTAATGVTTLVRTVSQSLGPVLAGLSLQILGAGVPFFVGGGLKIIYDLSLYFSFRSIRAPEEEAHHRKMRA